MVRKRIAPPTIDYSKVKTRKCEIVVVDGYNYRFARENEESTLYYCSNRGKKGCKASLKRIHATNNVRPKGIHCHEHEPEVGEAIKIKVSHFTYYYLF